MLKKRDQTIFKRIYSHPAWLFVGIVGSIASLISIPLAAYFYVKSWNYPQLTYYIHPVKAVLLQSDRASKLKATFEDKPIKTDVTTAQIAIWNQGSQSIKSANILKTFVIYTHNETPILEASIRKVSRDVTNLQITTEEINKGRLGVTWSILEPGDGAILQIIYSGTPEVDFLVDGVVEGQEEIAQIAFVGKIQSPEEQYHAERRRIRRFSFTLLFLAILLTALCFLLVYFKRKFRRPTNQVVMDYEEVEAIINRDTEKIKEFEGLKKASLEKPERTPAIIRVANIVIIFGLLSALIGFGVCIYTLMVVQRLSPPFGF